MLTVVTLAACGGGARAPASSRSQLIARVNGECRKLMQASNDLITAQDPNSRGTRVEQYLQRAASQLRSRGQAIGALTGPASTAGTMSRFVSLFNQYADGLDALANRIHRDETYTDLINRSTAQVNALNQFSSQTNRIAATLGFHACAT